MKYFESLLTKKNYDKCPLPLWKLKITDEEFEELRATLYECIKDHTHENPFIHHDCEIEATLFFAEYWRRMYEEGAHSIQMVFEALGEVMATDFWTNAFYEAACNGASKLGIEQYEGGRSALQEDMFYQGGLPMKLITGVKKYSNWERFTKGLVKRKINFEDLRKGKIFSKSRSMKEYCVQIIMSLEKDQPALMPFYCPNEYNPWFVYLVDLYKEENKKLRQSKPFSLFFEFEIDRVARRFKPYYVLEGPQRPSAQFIEEQNIKECLFFSCHLRENGYAKDTFDFKKGYCRYPVLSKHLYHQNDNISFYIHNQEEPHLNITLDLDVPHILYKLGDEIYELGNKIGQMDSLLLIPQNWIVEDDERYTIHEYTWNNTPFHVIEIDENFTENIKISGSDGTITFGINTPLYWTEISSHPLYQPNVIESIYDVKKCIFHLCHETEDETIKDLSPKTQFRNKWEHDWSSIPSYGEIFVKAVDNTSNYVTPERFINVGDGLIISPIEADKDSCSIRVTWKHGRVSTTEGTLKANNVWYVKKENCQDPTKIRFTFIPNENSRNLFTLNVKAPFKDFSIVDQDGDSIVRNEWIPFTDIDKYRYHLIGQNIKYTYGSVTRELEWYEDKLYIKQGGKKIKQIPYEGCLQTLFDSRETLRSLLDHTSKNILQAEIKVEFQISTSNILKFFIKESPFRIDQDDLNRVRFKGRNESIIKFKKKVKLLPLNNPLAEPIPLSCNSEGYYILPEEILPWGKTLLFGNTRGRICPGMVDISRLWSKEERKQNYIQTKAAITQELETAVLGDDLWNRIIGWFDTTQKYDIPARTLIELDCTAKKPETLLCLTFALYALSNDDDERNSLVEQLMGFSNDIGFQWYWLMSYSDNILQLLQSFIKDINNPIIKNMYRHWFYNHQKKDMNEFEGIEDDTTFYTYIVPCLNDVKNSFVKWMEKLMIASITDSYELIDNNHTLNLASAIIENPHSRIEELNIGYIDDCQKDKDLKQETVEFFNKYPQSGKTITEKWLYQRVDAVIDQFNKNTILFGKDEEIRRSIIFCCKSYNYQFLQVLTNKLLKNQHHEI